MGNAAVKLVSKTGTEAIKEAPAEFFALSATDITGKTLRFSTLRDQYRVFLLTNVACKCGLTGSQYTQLVELHNEYHDKGLAILAFPCNQFASQEPGTEADIEQHVREHYNAKFFLFSKVEVNGPNTHPVYRFLRSHSTLGSADQAKKIPWNFAKFLVDVQGKVVAYEPPNSPPRALEPHIRELLGLK